MKKIVFPTLGVLGAVGVFGAAPSFAGEYLPTVQFLAGLVGLIAVAAHVLAADEVERLVVWQAAAISFALCLVIAWAAATIGLPALWGYAWAVMMALWMLAYLTLRLRQL